MCNYINVVPKWYKPEFSEFNDNYDANVNILYIYPLQTVQKHVLVWVYYIFLN